MHAGACQSFAVEFVVFFDEVEKTTNSTRMRSVRESGSLTLPLVTPIEERNPQLFLQKPATISAI
jgi:hypothetical protein